MFESEGHGLALARLLTGRRRPPLVIVACWLADLVVASPRRARLYRWLYRSVDAVVVFSGNQVATLSARLGLPPGRVHVVRFGVDLDELAGVPVSDRGDVVAVGRDLGRDWATLLRACAGTDWQVELVTHALQLEGLEVPRRFAPTGASTALPTWSCSPVPASWWCPRRCASTPRGRRCCSRPCRWARRASSPTPRPCAST